MLGMLLFIVYVYIFVDTITMHQWLQSMNCIILFLNEMILCYDSNLWIACNLPTFRLPDFIIWLRKIYFSFTLNFCFHTEQTSLSFFLSFSFSLYRLLQRWKKQLLLSLLWPNLSEFSFFRKRCYTRAYFYDNFTTSFVRNTCSMILCFVLFYRGCLSPSRKLLFFIIFFLCTQFKYWDIPSSFFFSFAMNS